MSKPLDFPIPYPAQRPEEDLASARLMIEAIAFSMERGEPLSSAQTQSLFFVLCAATEKLEVIQLFLDDLDFPDDGDAYREARRMWVLQRGGKS